ncbi:DUF4118 domain-containing protein [Candidatus Korobacter versatilis]|uniref:DUF4118 domain-containing protein n=1 Tax=Candidatus Korobacter versatilis TaxID=658062 RepID=UPI0002E823A8|nr:DUF4118 domain-containing protein [Candidatus Koribacter versatilis]
MAGIVVSVLLAVFLIFSVRGTHRSLIVPVVFLVFIILCARYFGMLAGVVASIIASGLFAVFLFEPYGSLQIKDHQALWNLALMLFAGIALSYANSGNEDEPKAPKNS